MSRWKIAAEAIGVVTVVVGVLWSVFIYFKPGPSPSPPVTSGSVELSPTSTIFYPPGGEFPVVDPPDYPGGLNAYHCDVWKDWVKQNSIAGTDKFHALKVSAGASSPISIVSISARVFSKEPTSGHVRIGCTVMAGGYFGHIVTLDLDNPSALPLFEEQTSGRPAGTLPPASFIVEESTSETLGVQTQGSENYVYQFALTFEYYENGELRHAEFGTERNPLIAVPKDTAFRLADLYDWSVAEQRWVIKPRR